MQAWLPWDTPGAVRRFLRPLPPAAGVLMETEIWPNLLAEATRAAALPMVLANARLSERSRRRGRSVDVAAAAGVREPGAAPARRPRPMPRACARPASREVVVAGNLKFDVAPDAGAARARPRLEGGARRRPVVLARGRRARARRPTLLAAWRDAGRRREPLLVVVPRHPQRFDEVAALVAEAGFAPVAAQRLGRRRRPPRRPRADVWLGDSMGEMPPYYALADVALLGGSFAPLGGQNLIEAAACGCPVVMGPHTFNFAEAAELALAAGAALRVADIGDGVARALALVESGDERRRRGDAGLAFAAAHRGAAARMAEGILRRLRLGAQQRQRPDPGAVGEDLGVEAAPRRSAGGRRARPSAPRAGRW